MDWRLKQLFWECQSYMRNFNTVLVKHIGPVCYSNAHDLDYSVKSNALCVLNHILWIFHGS